MEFYNVKKKAKVKIADANCEKVVFSKKTSKGIQKRYAARSVDTDGTPVMKFITEKDYEKLPCKVGKVKAKK